MRSCHQELENVRILSEISKHSGPVTRGRVSDSKSLGPTGFFTSPVKDCSKVLRLRRPDPCETFGDETLFLLFIYRLWCVSLSTEVRR